MRRLLVLQTAQIGEVVMTTGLLAALRQALPGVVISAMATPAGGQVLAGQPAVDEAVVFDRHGADRGLRGLWRLARRLQAASFDAVVSAHRSHRAGLLARLCGAERKIGFDRGPGAWAYDRAVSWEGSLPGAERYLRLGEPLGVDLAAADPTPRLRVLPEAAAEVHQLLADEGIPPAAALGVVVPGASAATKRWRPEGFAEVLRGLPARGLRPVLAGGAADVELCREVAERAAGEVVSVAGRTSLRTLIALLARARVVLTNDGGPGHIAAAVGTAVVSIFGPTHPSRGGAPYGARTYVVQNNELDCRPCSDRGPRRCPLGHWRCMRDLGPHEVLEALGGALAERSAGDAGRARGPGMAPDSPDRP